jgi:hypothetical protein
MSRNDLSAVKKLSVSQAQYLMLLSHLLDSIQHCSSTTMKESGNFKTEKAWLCFLTH